MNFIFCLSGLLGFGVLLSQGTHTYFEIDKPIRSCVRYSVNALVELILRVFCKSLCFEKRSVKTCILPQEHMVRVGKNVMRLRSISGR